MPDRRELLVSKWTDEDRTLPGTRWNTLISNRAEWGGIVRASAEQDGAH